MARTAVTPRTATSRPLRPALFEQLEGRRYLSTTVGAAGDGGDGAAAMTETVPRLDAPAVPAAADATGVSKPLKVYSWSDWDIEGVTPMTWVRMHANNPRGMADETIPKLLAQEPGDRVLFLWNLGGKFMDGSLDQTVNHGLNSGPDRQWLTEYFGLLKDAGITPDYIVMDYEGGKNFWNTPTPEIQRVMNDASLRQKLPQSLQQYEAGDFDYRSPQWRDAVMEWNTWSNRGVADALKDAVRTPALETFGREIPMSNWLDSQPGKTVYDPNGWAQTADQGASVAGWSSPALYLGGAGQMYDRYADPKWANFVTNMNTLRSMIDGGGAVAPWITDARFDNEEGLWENQVRQIRASGVDTVLLWNHEQAELSDERFAEVQRQTREALEAALAMPDAPGAEVADLPQNALDAQRVQTRGYGIDRFERNSFVPKTLDPVIDPTAAPQTIVHGTQSPVFKLPTVVPAAAPAAPAPAPAEPEQDPRSEIAYRAPRGDLRVSFFDTPAATQVVTAAATPVATNATDDVDLQHTVTSLLEQLRFRIAALHDDAESDDVLQVVHAQ